MVQRIKTFVLNRKWSMLALLAGIAILVASGLFLGQKGISYKDGFLVRQTENIWQGRSMGETVTVIRTPQADGVGLQLVCDSGEKQFYVTGEVGYNNSVRVYEDDMLVFEGKYMSGGILMDANEDWVDTLAIGYSSGGTTYVLDENGNSVRDTALRIGYATVVSLALDLQEDTRGLVAVVFFAAIILIVFFVELWCPQIMFHWDVGRFVAGDAEPSDEYLAKRAFALIVTAFSFFVVLLMGMVQ